MSVMRWELCADPRSRLCCDTGLPEGDTLPTGEGGKMPEVPGVLLEEDEAAAVACLTKRRARGAKLEEPLLLGVVPPGPRTEFAGVRRCSTFPCEMAILWNISSPPPPIPPPWLPGPPFETRAEEGDPNFKDMGEMPSGVGIMPVAFQASGVLNAGVFQPEVAPGGGGGPGVREREADRGAPP